MENLEALIEHLNNGHSISGNSKLHQIMVRQNTEARKITMKMNNQFHEMSDLRRMKNKKNSSTITHLNFFIFACLKVLC